jgi:dCMP deaminase
VSSRPSMDTIFMTLAGLIARRSTCERLKVGCVIVDAEKIRVLSIGYNGNYTGGPNKCDSLEPGKCGCLHAEDNACVKLDYREPVKIAYVTHLPCKICAKRLVNAGVTKVYYNNTYRYTEGLKVLKKAKVKIKQLQLEGK